MMSKIPLKNISFSSDIATSICGSKIKVDDKNLDDIVHSLIEDVKILKKQMHDLKNAYKLGLLNED